MKVVLQGFNLTLILLVLIIQGDLKAQIGGDYVYGFLSQAPSARQAALGNAAIAYEYPNSSLIFVNPALISSRHNYSASAQHQFGFSGIGNGSISYVQSLIDTTWAFGLGVQYTDYGTFQAYDEYEILHGTFTALDASVQGTVAKQLSPRLHIGTSVKFISSTYERYNSIGLGVDIGAYYFIPESNLGLVFLMKNLAVQLTTYGEVREKKIPVDFMLGMSKGLEHLPLRFQITYHHLNKWDLLGEEIGTDLNTILNPNEKSQLDILANNFLAHLVFSAELAIGKNKPVFLRVAYNHAKGETLSVEYYRAFTGISMGLGINIKGVRFDYAYTISHLAGGKHALGIAYQLGGKPKKTTLRD